MLTEKDHLSKGGRKWLQSFFVMLFVLLLIAPTAQERFNFLSVAPVIENRKKAPQPTGLLGIFDSHSNYAQKYEAFYNDTYGLRDFLIKLKNQLDLWLFNISDEVLIGDDGWLFYRKLYQRDMRALELESVRLPILISRLLNINRYLASRGIKLVIVPCPAKTTLYPEHVPAGYPVYTKDTAFQRYRVALREHPELLSVDVQGILEELKPRMRVFHKTDFHWNDPAGAVVWRSVYSLLASEGGLPTPQLGRVHVKRVRETAGGEINSLAVFFPPLETALELKTRLMIPTGTTEDTGVPNTWTYTAPNSADPSLLPPTLLFGDSFSDAFLRAGFTAAFSKLYKRPNHEFAKSLLSIPDGTKFVIIEHIESFLLSMLLEPTWSPELLFELEKFSPTRSGQ